MYNLVFELMEIVGITEKLTELEWQNQLGERVSEVDTIGEMVDYKVTHPEHVLFVYGVGDNICQKNDMDDQKFLVKRGCQPRIFSSTPNAYWTTMEFTPSAGKPVPYGIITLSVEDRYGIDIFANWLDNILLEANYELGIFFSGGPRSTFNECDMPCYITPSPKGSITSHILVDILKWIDEIGVHPRQKNRPISFLLINRHESQLELPFLLYMNDPPHNCIRIPNGISVW